MTSKQKTEILVLLATAANCLAEAKRSMRDMSVILREEGEKGSAKAAVIAEGITVSQSHVEDIINDYAHLLSDIRSQAKRLLRLSLEG